MPLTLTLTLTLTLALALPHLNPNPSSDLDPNPDQVDLLRHFPHLARLEKRYATHIYTTEGSNPRLADPRQGSNPRQEETLDRFATHACEPRLGQALAAVPHVT